MAPSIEDRLTILLPIPAKIADDLGLEFSIGQEAIIQGEDPDDPDAKPEIVLDAFSMNLFVVKVAGHGPLLVEILQHLADEARRAWEKEKGRPATVLSEIIQRER
jgi:hypothetical protein